ncbi:MAG: ACP phosphodiesterase [Flavobacteriaceae bacterium]|nr:ACP phosphodiesterase [Flavobacteriaceae bacterium]
MIGNFIADHIKGKEMFNYNKGIQRGILLHRAIDEYTDKHPIVKISKDRLHPRYRHYDGVIIDIFYDYYLAKNWERYSSMPLDIFAQHVYELLENMPNLPTKTQRFSGYMIQYDLLVNYRDLDTIAQVLDGMNRRSKMKSQMHLAIEDLRSHENEFEQDFHTFFDDLQSFAQQKLTEIENTHS